MTHVLLVEDDELQGGLVSTVLRRIGCEVTHFKFARRGIEYAQNNTVDFIMLDLNLPDMHGVEAINELKAGDNTKETPILVITGSQLGEDKSMAWAAGCAGYIHKPFRPSELKEYLNQFIARITLEKADDSAAVASTAAIDPIIKLATDETIPSRRTLDESSDGKSLKDSLREAKQKYEQDDNNEDAKDATDK